MISKKISDRFLSNIGLFENMLGKYANLVAINQEKERIKKVLYEVYWYKDIYDFIPQELDKESMDKVLNTVFSYYDQPLEQVEK